MPLLELLPPSESDQGIKVIQRGDARNNVSATATEHGPFLKAQKGALNL